MTPSSRRRAGSARPSVAPQATASLVDHTLKWLKLDDTARAFRALEAFSRAAGPRIRERARAERLRGAILYVRVASAAWSHELHALKAQLLQKIRSTPGGEIVADLRFSVGPLDEVPTWERSPRASADEPPRPRVSDELLQAMGGVTDDELREQLTQLYARLGSRSRP
jgi:predicted nucleic acid-binding Zn ribbon protein